MKITWFRRTDGNGTITPEDASTETSQEQRSRLSRRVWGKNLLVGIPAGLAVWSATQPQVAEAGTDGDWTLAGNAVPNANAFIGTTNAQPLNIKTSNVLRMIVNAAGRVGINSASPIAQLQVVTSGSIGIFGDTSSTAPGAMGVLGRLVSPTSGTNAAGVRGTTVSRESLGGLFTNFAGAGTSGVGVRGLSASGRESDIHPGGGWFDAGGEFAGPNGAIGSASTDSNVGIGVIGLTAGTSGTGVYGSASSATGPTHGVQGYVNSPNGIGVRGGAPNSISSALNAVGVRGTGTVGVQGSGEYMGVQGSSPNYAVFGYTTPDTGGTGVYGRGANGVFGRSYAGNAVLGETNTGNGVYGHAYSDGGAVKGVYGFAAGVSSNGVVGEANNGTSAYGVWGKSTSGYAGVFSGKVLVTGTLSKGGGSFRIDHPQDPENKYLSHSFVESPDMMNIYNGNIVTDANGNATVQLPAYFSALNRDFRYQLTVIGKFAQAVVASKVANNQFTIRTDKPRVEVSWQVTGIRKDAWANANRIPVEENKTAAERGTLLHPQAFGKPETMDVQYERIQSLDSAQVRKLQPDPMPPAPQSSDAPTQDR